MVLLVALGLTGVGYAAWSDTINISGTVETGTITVELSCSNNHTAPSGGSVTCIVVSGALEVKVFNAETIYTYYGDFSIHNGGTIPVKMVIDPSSVPAGVTAEIINWTGDGIIDPLETESGTVHIYLVAEPPDNPSKGTDFTIIVSVVPWNQ